MSARCRRSEGAGSQLGQVCTRDRCGRRSAFAPWDLSWNQCQFSQGEKVVRDRLCPVKRGEGRKTASNAPKLHLRRERRRRAVPVIQSGTVYYRINVISRV